MRVPVRVSLELAPFFLIPGNRVFYLDCSGMIWYTFAIYHYSIVVWESTQEYGYSIDEGMVEKKFKRVLYAYTYHYC